MPTNSGKERKKRPVRQSERATYVATILAGLTFVCAVLWGSGALTHLTRIGRIIVFGVPTLVCIVLLLPGVQTWLARRHERQEMERWRK